MHMLVIKNTTNNTIYTMQELHTFLSTFNGITSKVSLYKAFHFHQHFHYILQLIYQLFFFTLTLFII